MSFWHCYVVNYFQRIVTDNSWEFLQTSRPVLIMVFGSWLRFRQEIHIQFIILYLSGQKLWEKVTYDIIQKNIITIVFLLHYSSQLCHHWIVFNVVEIHIESWNPRKACQDNTVKSWFVTKKSISKWIFSWVVIEGSIVIAQKRPDVTYRIWSPFIKTLL